MKEDLDRLIASWKEVKVGLKQLEERKKLLSEMILPNLEKLGIKEYDGVEIIEYDRLVLNAPKTFSKFPIDEFLKLVNVSTNKTIKAIGKDNIDELVEKTNHIKYLK